MKIERKMKKFNIKNAIIPIIVLLAACDDISQNNKTEFYSNIEDFKTDKTVLLEDFTGVNCSNCPRATSTASDLQHALGEQLIVVSIHAGVFATDSFRTETGDAYQQYFYPENNAYPAAMISCTKQAGDKYVVSDVPKWATLIIERLIDLSNPTSQTPNVKLNLAVNYNQGDSSFVVKSSVFAQQQPTNDLKLQLLLTENKIISNQAGDGGGQNYEHNHVLRDAINGTWGENIFVNINQSTDYFSEKYFLSKLKSTLAPRNSGKPENMKIIGFIYDNQTKEVIDVKEISLIEN